MKSTTRDLEREIKAAQMLRDQLSDMVGDDAELIRDSIEGETGLFEIIAAMAEADGEDAALIDATAAYIKKLQERKARIEARVDMRRALMANALEIAELTKFETAAGTVTRKAVPPKAVIVEEADIPARFFVPQEPKLDKAAVLKALKDRKTALSEIKAPVGSAEWSAEVERVNAEHPDVAGAVLSNAGYTIQIRR